MPGDPPHAAQLLDLSITNAGTKDKRSSLDACRDRTLTGYAVVCIDAGSGTFINPRGRWQLAAPSLFWLHHDIPHSYWPEPRWTERWFLFEGTAADSALANERLEPAHPVDALSPELLACFDRCWEAWHSNGPASHELAAACLRELIIRAHAERHGLLKPSRHHGPVGAALAIMADEACDGVSPADIADRIGASYTTLRRQFRQRTGHSMKDYLLKLQLQRACERLLAGDAVYEAAVASGFEDPYYFSRLFSKRIGVAPSQYAVSARL